MADQQTGIGTFTVLLEGTSAESAASAPKGAAQAGVPKDGPPSEAGIPVSTQGDSGDAFDQGKVEGPFVSKAMHPELAGLRMTDEGIRTIIGQEGYRDSAYPDAAGYSVGYGHYLGDGAQGKGTKITNQQGLSLLAKDLKRIESAVASKIKNKNLTDRQFTALTSFSYNTGSLPDSVATSVNDGNLMTAAAIMTKYNKSKDKNGVLSVNPDLVKRRAFETSLLKGK